MPKDSEARVWIPDVELPDVDIKWTFSHFDGREDRFNQPGDHNFTIILPEDVAKDMAEQGWAVREMKGYEEGDPPEHLLKVKISYKFEPPKIFLIIDDPEKGTRKLRAEERDLADIQRATTDRIDVVLTPSRWVNGQNSGISAYVKELYAKIRISRFRNMYEDIEEI